MKKQLQGIGMILFGMLLLWFSEIDPWVPIVEGLGTVSLWGGLVAGIIGVVLLFRKDN
ncbi:MAG: hypothetical protein ACOYIE_02285 [Agathobaculum sp.]|jgi:hypothetical protein|uniref:hypothetical protein n=1 Tax=Agathobaculum sp. TaxID=2048138 RepID=UPI003D931741